MAQAVKFQAESRDAAKNKGTGSRVARRLRKGGKIPAIIYGHKQAPVPIALPKESVLEMIKKRVHLAELSFGGASETVVIRDIQWDHLGKEILHLDFARVDLGELVETSVRIEFRGTAPGVNAGGTLEALHHSVLVACRADAIPDEIRVDVSHLEIGQAIHLREVALPAGATLKEDPELLVVHVTTKAPAPEPSTEAPEGSQPEVIKPERKDKDE